MRKILFVLGFGILLAPTVSPDVAQSQYVWTCRATSHSSVGIGQSASQASAARRALHECAIRTPSWDVCAVDSCW